MTLVLNYTHPFSDEQHAELTALLGSPPTVRDLAMHIDRARPLADIAVALADAAALTAQQWQTQPIILNPPALAPVAVALLAEIHGRAGYFVPIVSVRPVAGALPPRFEIAEIADLHAIRDAARSTR